MTATMTKGKRVTVKVDRIAQHSEAMLHGVRLVDQSRGLESIGTADNDGGPNSWPLAELREQWLAEALHALVAFREAHGFVPRQPRFDVVVDAAGLPGPARRWGLLPEVEAMHAAMAEEDDLGQNRSLNQ